MDSEATRDYEAELIEWYFCLEPEECKVRLATLWGRRVLGLSQPWMTDSMSYALKDYLLHGGRFDSGIFETACKTFEVTKGRQQ